ncbi:hypothetical protein EVAR_6669_1 [Eumeta japonica]|uniref:Uncharacterized protein n=1 Tax=Eumeta variegata TaxID=151549 RepID=A0A4C1TLE1_EUMVA|nr:hypothetical protein EVAR_6669_1 [Eumeta japonica]
MVHSPQPSARSPSFNPTSIGYPCSIQEADNAPATPSGVRAPVSGGGHLPRFRDKRAPADPIAKPTPTVDSFVRPSVRLPSLQRAVLFKP